jgi:hypothetical protein
MRVEMAEREARAEAARQQAALYAAQADGQGIQNKASGGLPGLMASFTPREAQLAPDANGDYQQMAAETPDAAFKRGLPAFVAALAQSQGDKVDTGDTIGALASFLSGDEMARRGMVAQGQTPSATFAITPERADDIAGIKNDADYRRATGVATINNRDDIPVAQIGADARRDVAITNNRDDIPVAQIGADARRDVAITNNRDDIPVANIRAGASRDVAGIKANGGGGFSLVSSALPGAVMTGGERTPERNAEVRGARGSKHLPGDGVEAYDVRPMANISFAEAKARMLAKHGDNLVEAIDETNRPGYAPHWHFAVRASGGGAKPGKTKMVSSAGMKTIDAEVKNRLEAVGGSGIQPRAKAAIRARAVALYQETGNPVAAVEQAMQERAREGRAVRERQTGTSAPQRSANSGPPVQGARKAPDGNWYVVRGKNADGSPAYSQVVL